MPTLFKYANLAAVYKRLVERFDLSEELLDLKYPVVLPLTIQPVTNFDELVKEQKLAQENKDISAAAGTYVPFHTVPEGKRWYLIRFERDSTTGNSRVAIDDGVNYNYLEAAGTAEKHEYAFRLPMPEGWSIGMMTTNNVADNARGLDIIYEEEDAF